MGVENIIHLLSDSVVVPGLVSAVVVISSLSLVEESKHNNL